MNKLTKIGASALAGSLVASAAHAGSVSVGATWEVTMENTDGSGDATYAALSNNGNPFGSKGNLSFSGSGETDFGTASWFMFTGDQQGSVSSHSITLDMGDMGVLAFDQGVGGNGLDAFDDKTPTAWEEANDGMTGALVYAGDESTNTFKYTNTVGGFGLNIAYDPTTGDTDQEDGEAGAAGSTGSSSSIAVTLPTGDYVDGLDMGVAMGKDDLKDGSASTTDIESWVAYANYSAGPVTIGYNQAETTGGTTGHSAYQIEGMGITFNVNDNLSIGYTNVEQEYANAGGTANVVEESTGISLAYTMGSATISVQNNEQDNPGGSSTAQDEERTEINLSLAF